MFGPYEGVLKCKAGSRNERSALRFPGLVGGCLCRIQVATILDHLLPQHADSTDQAFWSWTADSQAFERWNGSVQAGRAMQSEKR